MATGPKQKIADEVSGKALFNNNNNNKIKIFAFLPLGLCVYIVPETKTTFMGPFGEHYMRISQNIRMGAPGWRSGAPGWRSR